MVHILISRDFAFGILASLAVTVAAASGAVLARAGFSIIALVS